MKKILKKLILIAISIIGGILAFVIVAWGVLSIAKYPIYWDYYEMKSNVCENPGLNDGFVCQGICAYEEDGKFFVSGYMKDGSASRIYVTDVEDNSYYVTLKKANGDDFTGHAGGIAVANDTVYIANGGKVHSVSLIDLLNAEDGGTVSISDSFAVNNEASFIYADDDYVYVGEFHDGGKYVTEHPYLTEEGQNYAIVSRYPKGEFIAYDNDDGEAYAPAPDRVYSIRDKVQGICFTPNGEVVMSTSYGLSDSVYYIYSESEATDSGYTLDGAPVYFFDKCVKEFTGPAMAEGLDYYDGKVITLTESASDKYIFGKFFFATKIVALDIREKLTSI
ncbi:MAG: hypothetical protein IJ011_08920 [Clostridia bacterium]|nr:hypothetical protein [Clostridia bacterium]